MNTKIPIDHLQNKIFCHSQLDWESRQHKLWISDYPPKAGGNDIYEKKIIVVFIAFSNFSYCYFAETLIIKNY